MDVQRTKNWVTGDVLTAVDLNAEFDNLLAAPAIVNADISASAAIAYSKLALTGSILNADINSSAAIALSKLATGALPTGITIASANLVDGTIVDADVNASAAISLSKLATGALPTGITIASANITNDTIVDADVNSAAAISLSKLATGALPTGITIASANITDGTIVNADVNASAAIAESKLAFGGSAGQYVTSDGDGTLTWAVLTINRAFTWYLDGTSIVADEVGAKYIAPQNMTVVKIWYKTVSGTATIRIQKDTTDIDASNDVTSTLGSTTTITSAAITAGQVITLDITVASSCVGLTVCMECSSP